MTREKVDRKCKCPFDHYKAPISRPTGSDVHPDIHEFDHVVKQFDLTEEDNYAIELFKQLVKIPSVSGEVPQGHGVKCCNFFAQFMEIWGIEYRFMEFTKGYPIFYATIPGYDASLPALLLNNHYDVVPAIAEKWDYPPFDAIEENSYIIGRGTQDMKSMCIAQLISIIKSLIAAYKIKNPDAVITLNGEPSDIKKQLGGLKLLRRTIHFTSMPDEEVGGILGMKTWLDTPIEEIVKRNASKAENPYLASDKQELIAFDTLNIGFCLDEGLASTDNKILAFYNERCVWWLKVVAESTTGHGSRFIQDTAVEKIMCVVNSILTFRDSEYKKLHGEDINAVGCAHAKAYQLGDVTTVNCTMLNAGVKSGEGYAYNVIPTRAEAGFDFRIPQHVDIVQFEKDLRDMLPPGCKIEFFVKTEPNGLSAPSDEATAANKYWHTIRNTCNTLGYEVAPLTFPSATDAGFLRNTRHIQSYGFTPLINSPMMLHDHNERLNKYIFINAINITTHVVTDLTNLQ